MKKKLKLFLSIASLCFALAVLCFGVYSAQTVNYSLNGNVTYTVKDAYVEVQTKLYKSTTNLSRTQLGQKVNAIAGMDFVTTPEGLTLVDTSEVYSSINGATGSYEKPDLKFSTQEGSECYAYFFVINIKNLSPDVNVWAVIEDEFTNPANTIQINNKRQQTINQAGKNMVIGLTVEDFTQNIPTTNNEFRYSIKIGVGDLTIQEFNNGNVTYTVEEAIVEVQTKLYKSTTYLTSSQLGLKVNDVTEMDFASTPEGLTLVDTSEVYSSTSDIPGIYENIDLKFSTQEGSECYAYFFVINIKTLAPDINVWAVMEDELVNLPNTVQINNGLQQNINQAGKNMVIGIGIDDYTQNIPTEANSFSYGIKIGVGDLATQQFNLDKLAFDLNSDSSAYIVKANRSNMNGVVAIPNSYNNKPVTTIKGNHYPSGSFTFTNFTTIAMSDSIENIDLGYAFYGNQKLTNISLSQNLKDIGYETFGGCTKLSSIEIPSSVTSIDRGIFDDGCGLVKIEVAEGNTAYKSVNNCLIEKSTKTLKAGCKNSVIPSDGSVTIIGDYAFKGCTDLISIKIPSNVTSVGRYAFWNCTDLTEVLFDNGVTNIGYGAFDGCRSLTSITIPSSVTSIEQGAFSNCTNLTSITIPSSVTSIERSVFSGCTGLQYTDDASGLIYIKNTNNDGTVNKYFALYEAADEIADEGQETCIINENCKFILGNAFYQSYPYTSIQIPDGVISIGYEAFSGQCLLTSITIPSSVKSISATAFIDCYRLETITVDTGNPIYKAVNNCLIDTTTDTLIAGCKNSIIPTDGSVTSIGDYAFKGSLDLNSITIPSGVTSIGQHAFESCGLTSVSIPSSVTSIGDDAFSYCTDLQYTDTDNGVIYLKNTNSDGTVNNYFAVYDTLNETQETYIINENCKFILYDSFRNCTSLKSITIPESVISIGFDAFSYCTSLTSLTMKEGLKNIESCAFDGCTSLTSITIPRSVTYIGDCVFRGCTSLTSITIPDNVIIIGYGAFDSCRSLTSITIPSSVNTIGEYAFSGCTSLTSITIPNSVTNIGSWAFKGWTEEQTIYVPFAEGNTPSGWNSNWKGSNCKATIVYAS